MEVALTVSMKASAKVLVLGGVLVGCSSSSGPPTSGPFTYFYANPVDGGNVFGVRAGSNQPVALATGGSDHNIGNGFAFDADTLYFSDLQLSAGVGSPLVGSLLTLPRSGGSPQVLAGGLGQISAIALDGDVVYFIDSEVAGSAVQSFIASVPKAGGAVQHIADFPDDVAPVALAAANGSVYWTLLDGQVMRGSSAGGAPVALSTGEKKPFVIAVGAGGVYWLNVGTTQIDCTPNDGELRGIVGSQGQPVTLASGLQGATDIAVGPNQVFWSTSGAFCNVGGLGRGAVFGLSSSGGGAPRTLASGVTDPRNLFADAPTLHFTSTTDVETDSLAPETASF